MIECENITNEEMKEFFEANIETFTFLSQVFFKELTKEAIENLAEQDWPQDSGNEHLDHGYTLLKRYFKFSAGNRKSQLAVDFARIFLAAGINAQDQNVAVPYESVFTSKEHVVMADARDRVVDAFIQDGFKVNPELHEPEDHLSFELEYLAHMNKNALELLKGGNVKNLRKNIKRQIAFMDEHILNWVPLLLDCAKKFAKTAFYLGVLEVTIGAAEQARKCLQEVLDELPHVSL